MSKLPDHLHVYLPSRREPMTGGDYLFLLCIVIATVAPWLLLAWALLTGHFGR